MNKLSAPLTLVALLVLAGGAGAAGDAVVTGPGQGIVIDNPSPDTICPEGTLRDNTNGSYENGYAWAYGGAVAPYYGAWAEGFTNLSFGVCGLKLALTQVGGQDGWLMDVYVWDQSGFNPGNVLSVTTGVNPGTIGLWPQITQHDIDIPDIAAPGGYFVGWWGAWPGNVTGWFVAADEDGLGGGLPRTNIAPGIGYPTGWQHPNVVSSFTGCLDLGIATYEVPCPPSGGYSRCCLPDGSCQILMLADCEAQGGGWYGCRNCDEPCEAVPARTSSWGQIKAMFD